MDESRNWFNIGGVGLDHHLESAFLKIELTPFRVTGIYLVFGIFALYVSDVLFVRYFQEPFLSQLQAVKGAGEVFITSVLIFGLTQGSRTPIEMEALRLERQREELQVLHRILRHNLRNDLNQISGYIELLQDSIDSGQYETHCEKVLETVDDLLHYTEQANLIRQISEDINGRHSTIDLAEAIPEILDRNHIAHENGDVILDLPDQALVNANHMIEVAIGELLSNAIEHNDSSNPQVSLSVDQSATPIAETRIVVEDNGPGVDPETIEAIERKQEDQLVHMDGLGLWLVQWTVMESNGKLDIDSVNDGCRVTMTLPSAMDIGKTSISKAFAKA